MANDLNKLNDVLFETLDKVRNGEMQIDRAQTVVNLGTTIVNTAKVQVAAFKLSKGQTSIALLGKNNEAFGMIEQGKDVTRQSFELEFAKKEGYLNTAEALVHLGTNNFKEKVDEYIQVVS